MQLNKSKKIGCNRTNKYLRVASRSDLQSYGRLFDYHLNLKREGRGEGRVRRKK